MSHYETLGVGKDAGDEEIKKAYRKKAQQEHPDKPGGSDDRFRAVVRAYNVLSDAERRGRYDRTGEDEEQTVDNLRGEAYGHVLGIFMEAIDKLDVDTADLVGAVRQQIALAEKKLHNARVDVEKRIKRIERALRRVSKKGKVPGQDILAVGLRREVEKMTTNLKAAEVDLERFKIMKETIDDYAYAFDPAPAPPQGFTITLAELQSDLDDFYDENKHRGGRRGRY